MSLLGALVEAYDRFPGLPRPGYSTEKIAFAVSLRPDGSVARVDDLRTPQGKRALAPRLLAVPQPPKRSSGIAPNFLWDKTSYALGVGTTAGARLAAEHQAFVTLHADALRDVPDPGLRALLLFLRDWRPARFRAPDWPEALLDHNLVFRLEGDGAETFLHDRPAARQAWEAVRASRAGGTIATCLVTGETGPVARLHPSIKGVRGAQSAGASIVSFNLPAFLSYGHERGDNAPVSEAAAFKYTTVLNALLAEPRHRLQVGDATTVFWALAPRPEAAAEAETLFAAAFSQGDALREAGDDVVSAQLRRLRAGEPLSAVAPQLAAGVRFHVLALSPNEARLSVRLWLAEDFGRVVENYQRFVADVRLEPVGLAPLWRYLEETAVMGRGENVRPDLAGDWLRAILTGAPYPMTLLSTVLMRIRADRQVNGLRAAILRAVLVRNFGEDPDRRPTTDRQEAPMALDPTNANRGYLLGRLFAAYEQAQGAALGNGGAASLKSHFYASASVQPRKVFPLLDKGSVNHLSRLGKVRPAQRVTLEKTIGGLLDAMDPSDDPFPSYLSAQEQALFGLGYYHQRSDFFRRREGGDERGAAS